MTPLLASDTTIVAARALAFIGILWASGATLIGIVSLGLLFSLRRRSEFVVPGFICALGALAFGICATSYIVFVAEVRELKFLLPGLIPLSLGGIALACWLIVKPKR